MDFTKVIISPVVTEKSNNIQALSKYTFLVHLNANKLEVQNAVEKAYGVKVKSINIIPVHKKVRTVGRGREITKRHNGRKAIITLQAKQSIDFNKIK